MVWWHLMVMRTSPTVCTALSCSAPEPSSAASTVLLSKHSRSQAIMCSASGSTLNCSCRAPCPWLEAHHELASVFMPSTHTSAAPQQPADRSA